MARECGANKVYFASAAPPVRFPNVYGIDMPSVQELVANGRSEEQIAREIGADRLIYQDLDDLIESAREGNAALTTFDASCFDGKYITGHVSPEYLNHIEGLRSDGIREKHSGGKSGSVEPRVFAVR